MSTSPSEGRIVTQNPALLGMLRERTKDLDNRVENLQDRPHNGGGHRKHQDSVQKVYVDDADLLSDGDDYDDDDDDKYGFVDPDVDAEHSQEEGFFLDYAEPGLLPQSRSFTHYNKQSSGYAQKESFTQDDHDRYEDRESEEPPMSGFREDLQQKHRATGRHAAVPALEVVRSHPPAIQPVQNEKQAVRQTGRESQTTHHRSPVPSKVKHQSTPGTKVFPGKPKVIQPVRMSDQSRLEEEQDQRELEQEALYQEALKKHLNEMQRESRNVNIIPRLDLAQLEEEENRNAQFPAFDMSDSLDEDEEQFVQDSLDMSEEGVKKPAGATGTSGNQDVRSHAHVKHPSNNSVPGQRGSSNRDPQPFAGEESRFQTVFKQQEHFQESMSRSVNNRSQRRTQESQPVSKQPQHAQSTDHQASQVPLAQNSEVSPYDIPAVEGLHYFYDENGQLWQAQGIPTGHYYQPQEEYSNSGDIGSHHQAEEDAQAGYMPVSPTVTSTAQSSPRKPPSKDFINTNKKAIAKPRSGKSYRKVYSQRKELKENQPLSPVVKPFGKAHGSGKVASAPPREQKLSPQSDATRGTSPADLVDSEGKRAVVSAEALWQKRSRSLAGQKEQRIAKKTGETSPRRNKLQGKTSDSTGISRGDQGMPKLQSPRKPTNQVGTPNHPKPYHLRPMEMSPPSNVEGLPSTQPVTAQPVTHVLQTEDGQKFSFDINLNVSSPHMTRNGAPQYLQQAVPVMSQHPAGGLVGMQQVPVMLPIYQQPRVIDPNLMSMQPPPVHPVVAFQEPALSTHHPTTVLPSDYQVYYSNQFGPRHVPSETSLSSQTPTSPYKVLPPISSAGVNKGPSEVPEDEGYGAQFQKQKNKPRKEYKKYTLDDYRKLNKEVRLGGLGPDRGNKAVQEKREKRERQLEYARQVKDKTQSIQKSPQSLSAMTGQLRQPDDKEEDLIDRRKVALEYAKTVPKPVVRANKPARGERGKGYSDRSEPDLEIIDLQRLQQRHDLERQQVALIQQNMAASASKA